MLVYWMFYVVVRQMIQSWCLLRGFDLHDVMCLLLENYIDVMIVYKFDC